MTLKIATRLWIPTAAMACLVAAMGTATVLRTTSQVAQSDEIARNQESKLFDAASWQGLTNANAARVMTLLVGSDPALEAALKPEIEATTARIDAIAKRVELAAASDDEKSGLARIAAARKSYIDARTVAKKSKAAGDADAAKAQLDLLIAGTRSEEIDRARGADASAAAAVVRTEAVFARQQDLARRDIASQQTFDDARAMLDQARAQRIQTAAMLAEATAGPRPLEIEAGRAQFRAAEATLRLAHEQLSHTRRVAPADGTIMTRVVEKGSVVLPTSPIYSMAMAGEVWVRAFAPEPWLGRLVPGALVTISSDGGRTWQGRIGYVSPMAEFTPKTVETPELRTQLVYRLRIRVENPDDAIRQGMPVTVQLK